MPNWFVKSWNRLQTLPGRLRRLPQFHRLSVWASSKGADFFIAFYWPLPWLRPWRRCRMVVASRGGGIGDELMAFSVLQQVKQANERIEITFKTRFPELFHGQPELHQVLPHSQPLPAADFILRYDRGRPPFRALPVMLGEGLGLKVQSVPPRLQLPSVSAAFKNRVANLPRPLLVLQTCASKWTPNKDWIPDHWLTFIQQVRHYATLIEVGTDSIFSHGQRPSQSHFHSWVGETSVSEFVYLVAQADGFIGPVSGGMHVAATFGVPAICIAGGYEHPEGYGAGFASVQFVYEAVPCAPCWLLSPCPYQKKCFHQISPAKICSMAEALLNVRPFEPSTPKTFDPMTQP